LRCRACVLATVFVTSVHRAGVDSADAGAGRRSKAAIVLGATGWQTFWYAVTLLTSNGALIYGVILCNARAMGSLARCQLSGLSAAGQHTTAARGDFGHNRYQSVAFCCRVAAGHSGGHAGYQVGGRGGGRTPRSRPRRRPARAAPI
jgi:ABC-type sulfate transport system permease subunit